MGQNIKNFREWQQINEGWWEDVVNFFTGGSSTATNIEKKDQGKEEKDKGTQETTIKPTPGLDPEKEDRVIAKEYNFHLIPDGKPASSANYRSGQMSLEKLEYVIKKYGIKNIIRLNGDSEADKLSIGGDKQSVSTSAERDLCQRLGCTYHTTGNNAHVSSHSGYDPNVGYENSIDEVTKILNRGNTLIHCKHGADRTGGMVAGYLKKVGAMTDPKKLWDYTTQYNGWKGYIKQSDNERKSGIFWSGYDKYAASIVPEDQLGKGYFV